LSVVIGFDYALYPDAWSSGSIPDNTPMKRIKHLAKLFFNFYGCTPDEQFVKILLYSTNFIWIVAVIAVTLNVYPRMKSLKESERNLTHQVDSLNNQVDSMRNEMQRDYYMFHEFDNGLDSFHVDSLKFAWRRVDYALAYDELNHLEEENFLLRDQIACIRELVKELDQELSREVNKLY
jgi:hypothetical protein